MYLAAEDAVAVEVVLRVLEEQISQLGSASRVRGTLDEWAQQLSSTPPGFLPSLPAG